MQALIAKVLRPHHASVVATLTSPEHQIEGKARFRPYAMPLFEKPYLLLGPRQPIVDIGPVAAELPSRSLKLAWKGALSGRSFS